MVRPFPDVNAGLWHIAEGSQPLWARDGRELFYRAPDGAIMSVRVDRGPTWTTTKPAKLIEGRYYAGTGANPTARTYDVGKDKRFLMTKEGSGIGQPVAAAIVSVVQNWREELKRLVPTK